MYKILVKMTDNFEFTKSKIRSLIFIDKTFRRLLLMNAFIKIKF